MCNWVSFLCSRCGWQGDTPGGAGAPSALTARLGVRRLYSRQRTLRFLPGTVTSASTRSQRQQLRDARHLQPPRQHHGPPADTSRSAVGLFGVFRWNSIDFKHRSWGGRYRMYIKYICMNLENTVLTDGATVGNLLFFLGGNFSPTD